jgi:hypothetical protein
MSNRTKMLNINLVQSTSVPYSIDVYHFNDDLHSKDTTLSSEKPGHPVGRPIITVNYKSSWYSVT